jgi:hypothetical protein
VIRADAPQEAIFNALADARTYPDWWKPVYIEVDGDEPPGEGATTRQDFKGKLPYSLAPNSDGRIHVRFDWISMPIAPSSAT